MIYLTAQQVLFLHARLEAETGGSHGVQDLSMLISAVGRPQASYDKQDLYPDMYTKAAALMDSLVRNHPFMDGNKRTGIAAASLFLLANNYRVNASNLEIENFTLEVAQSLHMIDRMADWFQSHSQRVDD